MSTQSFELGKPYRVTTSSGKTFLLVKDRSAQIPTTFALMATQAPHKVALRISGGCKGMGPEDKIEMLDFFSRGFRGYEGMIWSGGTRQTSAEGMIDLMVTDIPGAIALQNPTCIALGSVPRTDLLRLEGDSQLVLDDYGTRPNPGMAAILVVQDGAEGKLGWDGDLDDAFGLMQSLRQFGGFHHVGFVAWNGGEVTGKEIMRSAKMGWPTYLVEGSGRVTDEIIAKLRGRDAAFLAEIPKSNQMIIVDKNNPEDFREKLRSCGFMTN